MSPDQHPIERSADSQPISTGNEAVDAVLDSVAELDARPLEEHAQVFETAQERLRHALDAPGQSS